MKNPIGIIKCAVSLLYKLDRGAFAVLTLITLVNSALPFLSFYITAKIFARAVEAISNQALPSGVIYSFGQYFLAFCAVTFAQGLVSKVDELKKYKFQLTCKLAIQRLVLEKASTLGLPYFETIKPYAEVERLLNEASFHPISVINKVFSIIGGVFALVVALSIVYSWRPWIVLLLMVAPLLHYLVSTVVAKDASSMHRQREKSELRAMSASSILLAEYFAKEVKAFNLSAFFIPRFIRHSKEAISVCLAHQRRRFFWNGILGSIISLERPAMYGFAINSLIRHAIDVAQFGLYTQSVVSIQAGIGNIVVALAEIGQHEYFISSLDSFLRAQNVVPVAQIQNRAREMRLAEIPALEFRDVYFSYPGKEVEVLNGVSFKVSKGQTICLAGKNGSGKSTIAKLIAGLYHPTKGEVLIDGHSTFDLSSEEIRKKVAILLQDFAIYHLTVAENVGLGRSEAMDSESIREVAALVGVDSFVRDLPQKYETVVGRFIEIGHSLSGGQEQMLGVARAVYKDSPILVFDEPTAALDAQNSRAFFEKILDPSLSTDRCTILISHTFKAITRCDRILYLERGCVVEDGTHSDLLSRKGKYAEDYELNVLERV